MPGGGFSMPGGGEMTGVGGVPGGGGMSGGSMGGGPPTGGMPPGMGGDMGGGMPGMDSSRGEPSMGGGGGIAGTGTSGGGRVRADGNSVGCESMVSKIKEQGISSTPSVDQMSNCDSTRFILRLYLQCKENPGMAGTNMDICGVTCWGC